MTDNITSNKTGHPTPSAANESTLQQPSDVPQCSRCLNQVGHSDDRCPLQPQLTAVRQTTIVNPRPGAGGTTTSGLVISVGVSHTWHYGSPTATVAVQIPTGVNETPTDAVQICNKPKRRRRKRPDTAARALPPTRLLSGLGGLGEQGGGGRRGGARRGGVDSDLDTTVSDDRSDFLAGDGGDGGNGGGGHFPACRKPQLWQYGWYCPVWEFPQRGHLRSIPKY
ncbi:hypothetical protein ALT_5346 [Aspergillus lentulus]|uniref:Uncharacterized protein n=1 Tax=Aspergillus lentulus TaxID=293939 RepID=A0AAN5YGF3_ASPLE|nr:hypothetical protein CNMCM6069_000717 [Aspergillus lentulus]KAF4163669.1 hypothetical protein CNMCM6936_000523 [Aspergillus lentulus]KAF4171269.1 hypothetical protein CNMCM8060_003161 [Aspergillus lentulus]KAF4177637.1 hypothetical protein CNMCM7927_003030 [Aspergillus lentulus]KAF4187840.1 hypothetical protein CNMCM8694_005276 [Aspergillus lentulus]